MKIFVAAEAAREVLGEGRRPDMDVLAVVNTQTICRHGGALVLEEWLQRQR